MTILPPERIASVSGFGLSASADGYLYRPATVEEIGAVLEIARKSGRQVVLRGAGNSYGDAAIADEAIILDISRLNRVLSWDAEAGVIEVEGGVTLEDIWRHCLEDGYWPPVVSGTMFPTIAGALAMNIHGKNNFNAGPLGEHVLELDVLQTNGEVKTHRPGSDMFKAVISSAGLLGIIVRVRLKMKRIHSGDLRVVPISVANWDEQFDTFHKFQHEADYLVSWIDCFARGTSFGRGIVHAGFYTNEPEDRPSSLLPTHQDLPDAIMGLVPKSIVWRFLKMLNTREDMRFLNWAKYVSGKYVGAMPYHQSLVAFSFLLDYVPNFRKAYLPGGFIQYQCFVPKERAPEVFSRLVEMQQEAKLEAFLAVMKRHRRDEFLFSHAVDGYSLAMDFKVGDYNRAKLFALAHAMNDVVLDANGRFYLAKDSTLRPSDFATYIGEESLATFRRLKAECDPENLLTSALGQRIGLVSGSLHEG